MTTKAFWQWTITITTTITSSFRALLRTACQQIKIGILCRRVVFTAKVCNIFSLLSPLLLLLLSSPVRYAIQTHTHAHVHIESISNNERSHSFFSRCCRCSLETLSLRNAFSTKSTGNKTIRAVIHFMICVRSLVGFFSIPIVQFCPSLLFAFSFRFDSDSITQLTHPNATAASALLLLFLNIFRSLSLSFISTAMI